MASEALRSREHGHFYTRFEAISKRTNVTITLKLSKSVTYAGQATAAPASTGPTLSTRTPSFRQRCQSSYPSALTLSTQTRAALHHYYNVDNSSIQYTSYNVETQHNVNTRACANMTIINIQPTTKQTLTLNMVCKFCVFDLSTTWIREKCSSRIWT